MISRSQLKKLKKELKKQKRIYNHLFGDDAPVPIVSATVQVGTQTTPAGYDQFGVPRFHTSPVFEEVTEPVQAARVLDLSQRVKLMKIRLETCEEMFSSSSSSSSS